MILKSVIWDQPTNSVEVTWVDESGVNVRCQSYADVQMDDMTADLGGDAPEYASLVADVRASIQPYVPPPPVIPYSVTPFQARVALYQAGLLTQIETIIANPATPTLTKLAWEFATEFTRDSPTLAGLATMLGLTSEQVDGLFQAAYAVEA